MADLAIFETLFDTLPNGDITPRVRLRSEGVEFGKGASFGPDFRPNGYSLNDWRGRKIWGHVESGVFVVEAVG
jgi:hypothetical protein